MMTNYVYRAIRDNEAKADRYEVGFWCPPTQVAQWTIGQWYCESSHDTRQEAASRVSFLNGGIEPIIVERILDAIRQLNITVRNLR